MLLGLRFVCLFFSGAVAVSFLALVCNTVQQRMIGICCTAIACYELTTINDLVVILETKIANDVCSIPIWHAVCMCVDM